ncbi:NADH dehydrogenase [ubiquinone] 1 beta subcomplex subunit 10, partial [Trichinella spiralis]
LSTGVWSLQTLKFYKMMKQCVIKLVPAAFTSAPTLERSLRYYWGRQLWFMSHLWKRWVEEYLVTLTTREKWTKIRLQSENGDLVFLVEEGVTGGSWITYSSGTSLSSEVKISYRNLGRILPTATCLVSGDHLVASWSRLEVFLRLSVPQLIHFEMAGRLDRYPYSSDTAFAVSSSVAILAHDGDLLILSRIHPLYLVLPSICEMPQNYRQPFGQMVECLTERCSILEKNELLRSGIDKVCDSFVLPGDNMRVYSFNEVKCVDWLAENVEILKARFIDKKMLHHSILTNEKSLNCYAVDVLSEYLCEKLSNLLRQRYKITSEEKAKLHKVVKHVGGEISDPTENYCQSSTKKLKSSEQVQETRREQGPVEQSPNGTGRVQYRRGRRQRAGWPARVDGSAFPRDGRPSGGLGARPEGWRTGLRHRRLGEEPEALFGSSGRSRTTDRRAATAATAATPDKLPLRLESGSCRSSRSCSSMGKCWNSPRSRRSLRRASTEEPIWTPLRSSLTCCRARHSRHSSPLPGSGGYLIEAVWSAEDRGACALLGLVEGTGVPRDDMTGHSSFGGLNHQALKMSCSDGEGSPCWRAPVERSPDAWAEGKIPSRVAEGLGPKDAASVAVANDPKSVVEARSCHESNEWLEAMKRESEALQLPQKSLTMPGEACKGGSFSKERLTILLAANAAGEKLVPLVIGKTAYPRAFRDARVDVSKLPVTWKYSKSTWMSAEIFVEWLKAVNATMRQQHRKILLLLDNAPSHLNVELSNVKLEFLPAKSTSCLQPMDLGVLRQFKCKYRSHLLQSLLANAETYEHAYKFFSRITVLDAVCWISQSWNEVESEVIVIRKNQKTSTSGTTSLERLQNANTWNCDIYQLKAVWSAEDRGARALLGLVEGTGVPRDDMTGHSSFGGLNHQALKMSCSDGEGSPCWRAPVERSPDAWAEGKIPSRVAEGLGPKANAETYEHAYKFFSRITVLDAVRWISQSWNEVESEVIVKCFKPSGISSPEDATTEKDENIACLNGLVTLHTAVSERRLITDDIINVQDYAAIDDEANVHECTEGTADEIVKELLSKSNAKEVLSEEVEGPLDEKLTYSEAITMTRKLQRYSFQEHPYTAPTLLQIESKKQHAMDCVSMETHEHSCDSLTLTGAEIPTTEDPTHVTFSNLEMPPSAGNQGSKDPLHCPVRRQMHLKRMVEKITGIEDIDIRYHFIREAAERKYVELRYLPTEQIVADILTKGLFKPNHEKCNMASGETLAERYKREDKEISKAFWEVLDINSRGTILLRFKYYVWRMLDIPATWMKENIVDPLQKDRKMPYYHRRFNRVRTIDECAVDDRVCYEEAQMQYHLDKMVDGYILDILRNRMQRCREYYMNNAEYKCAKCIDDFEQAELNFYIKYGDMGYYGDVLTAYTKQKHRMIWERRHPEIMAARAEAHEEHKRQMELGNYDPSFWKRKDPRLYKDYVISIFTPYNYSSFLRFKRDEPSQDPKFYTEREEARQKGEYKEPANPNLIWP